MTECPHCHSTDGTKKEGDIWHCKNCNGEHKISLKPQATEDSHATTASTPASTGSGKVSTTAKPDASEHETHERPATRDNGTDPK